MAFNYKIKLTEEFLEEYEKVSDYISVNLKAPEASKKLRTKIITNVLLLKNSPKMYSEIEKVDRVKRQYRKMLINNYVILYTLDDYNKIVYIAHIYYEGRNYLEGLI